MCSNDSELKTIHCIYCDKVLNNRSEGDHIIPQGLGTFKPNLTIMNSCVDCDAKNGNTFELIAMRTGFVSFLRSIHRVKSKNNRKKPIKSPSLDKFQAIESVEFAINNLSRPSEPIYIGSDGRVRFANFIQITKNDSIVEKAFAPITRDVTAICDFIDETFAKYSPEYMCELNFSKDLRDNVNKELLRRGRKFHGEPTSIHEEEFLIIKLETILTDNHFRFVANILLKGMLYSGYTKQLLINVLHFVTTGARDNVIYSMIDAKESGFDMLDSPSLSEFYHTFTWNVSSSSIDFTASLFAHRSVNGIRMKISFEAGEDDSIIIPYGSIVAKYGATSNDGVIEIFKGDSKIS